MSCHRDIANKLYQDLPARLKPHGLDLVSVGWDDAARSFGSSIGSNISDWSFMLPGPESTVLKFIRHPNFSDRTLTVSTTDICVIVGNHEPGDKLYPITLKEYLKNYSKYNQGFPEGLDLSNGDEDEQVTIRYIAVIVPVGSDGRQELVPTCYSYQTYDKSNPRNYLSCSFHQGTGSHTDGPRCEKVFLVKTNTDGSQDDCWIKVTDEEDETEEEKKNRFL